MFCNIVVGKIPTDKVYEDGEMIVFPDINPSAPIHLLFVSKSHGEEFHNVDLGKLGRILAKVKEKVVEFNVPYRVAMNGAGANLVPNHLHVHLLGKISRERKV